MFLGTYDIDEYVNIPAVTHRFSSGAAYAPTAITYSIYEEGNATGLDEDVDMTPASPFDAVVGLYYARRQLTAAAGFERNKTYVAVVKATVDSVAAIEAHVFQVRQLPNFTGTGTSANLKVDVETVKTQTVTCGAGVTVLASVGTAATSTAQTGDSYALANGASGFVALKGDTAAILSDTGTDGVVVATGSKAGYSLAADQSAVTVGTVTNVGTVTGNVNGSVGSVTGAVGSVTGAVGSVTGAVGSVTAGVTVTTNNDKTGYALADATSDAVIADAVWNAATATYGGVGSYGVLIETDLDATISSRASQTSLDTLDDYVDTEVTSIKAKTDQLNFTGTDVKATLDGETVTASSVTDKTGYAIGTGGIANTAFAAGAIDAAAIAADAIGASEIAANAIGASELAQDAAQEIADEVLNRDIAGSASGGARTVRSALRKLRNKVAISGGTLTVYAENDTTADHTEAVTTTAGDPISATDPST